MMSRLDIYITDKGLAKSRERAKKLIKNGKVTLNGKICVKPSAEVSEHDNVKVDNTDEEIVGRGLLKLEKAFDAFKISIEGKVCADIGASTGGFTQCMLRHGASFVYAVDVGHGQLDLCLCNDSRVKNCEGVNARYLERSFFDVTPQFMSVDLSFISLKLVIPALSKCICENSEMAVLIKPQFEAGKSALNKKGIVKNINDHIRVLNDLTACFQQNGLSVEGLVPSSILGGDGNIEYLAYLKRTNSISKFMLDFDIKKFTNETFASFGKIK